MSMTYVGAGGETETELIKALHIDTLKPPDISAKYTQKATALIEFAAMQKLLNAPVKDGLELHTANALWGQQDFAFKPDYIKSIKDSFGGQLENVDFNDEPAARKRINDWVANQTKDKIKDLIGPKALTPLTRLVLTNAIYFKAAWQEQFNKQATLKEKFHLSADKDVDADMMRNNKRFDYAELDGFKMLSLPYKTGQASMLVLLPDKLDGLDAMEKSLTAEKLAGWAAKLKNTQVAVMLPKFKSTCSFELAKPLAALGIKKAFTTAADFGGMTTKPEDALYISAVLHKAFVDVNEEGTEAAAATAVAVAAANGHSSKPVDFVADHPFVYIIRDNRTGDVLFVGRLADPSQKGE
jgi:serpin B